MADESNNNDVLFVITKQNVWKITTVILLILVIAFLVKERIAVAQLPLQAVPSQPSQVPSQNTVPSDSVTAGVVVDVNADNDPVLGKDNAPVTVIEFSDFQCPFCERAYSDAVRQLKRDYVDAGKARLVYRDYPLDFHPQAQKAAEAAECAHEQGKFWEYHNKLFENQAALSVENYKKWAGELKLDTAKFNSCLDTGKYAEEVKKDLAEGQAAGVSGTPTFFVNGERLVGAVPYVQLKALVDKKLAE